ncbi:TETRATRICOPEPTIDE REPEAT PROTEIN 5 [Salix purpurea]|uniref:TETRATRICOPEPTIDE REPEAT PROTEIN 5 n=1 Tax=Salix purpurea TaxID=77065 RepID=A0A9Q0U9V5_SALPP|nr:TETRATRICOPEPTIDE REPEAT PROTEIN 5 [Salix purpurea]
MGRAQDARNVFEEILVANPLSFEALFENALLMDRFGEGEAVIRRLQEALDIAEEENKVKEARDVRLIMAQIHFLQKECGGSVEKNEEAKQQFAKYRELSPKKFEVEGYLRTSLSRMKLFGSNEKN